MNCPKCGSALDTGFNCPNCGYKRYEQQESIQPELTTAEIPIEKASTCSIFESYLIIATTDGIEYKCSSYEIIGKTMYLYGVETEAINMAFDKANEQEDKSSL